MPTPQRIHFGKELNILYPLRRLISTKPVVEKLASIASLILRKGGLSKGGATAAKLTVSSLIYQETRGGHTTSGYIQAKCKEVAIIQLIGNIISMRLIIIIICCLVPFLALVSYALFLTVRSNFHMITKGEAYRSAQMRAAKLRRCIKKYNIKSVLNLREKNPNENWYDEEIKVCTEHGVIHYDVFLSSDRELTQEEIDALLALFKAAPRPILIHCFGGSDRTGLVAAMWKMSVNRASKREAGKQLTIWYGHRPFGKASAMDRYFEKWSHDLIIENDTHNSSDKNS